MKKLQFTICKQFFSNLITPYACTAPIFYRNSGPLHHQSTTHHPPADHALPTLAAVPAIEAGALLLGEETVSGGGDSAEEAVCLLVQMRTSGVHGREGGPQRAGGGR
jgi:hypothetical protein